MPVAGGGFKDWNGRVGRTDARYSPAVRKPLSKGQPAEVRVA